MPSGKVVDFKSRAATEAAAAEPVVNHEAVAMVEELLGRLRSGASVAIGIVEVYAVAGGATAFSGASEYGKAHDLHSLTHHLAHRIVTTPWS